MNKRGLSAIVTVVILVAIAIVAVGIIWLSIRNIITDTEENLEISSSKI